MWRGKQGSRRTDNTQPGAALARGGVSERCARWQLYAHRLLDLTARQPRHGSRRLRFCPASHRLVRYHRLRQHASLSNDPTPLPTSATPAYRLAHSTRASHATRSALLPPHQPACARCSHGVSTEDTSSGAVRRALPPTGSGSEVCRGGGEGARGGTGRDGHTPH